MTNIEPEYRAYLRMAEEAQYRPAAPSDGFGNITRPLEELDIREEGIRYALRFDEETPDFNIGCAAFHSRRALVFLIEAARSVCGVQDDLAIKLIEMALADLRKDPKNLSLK